MQSVNGIITFKHDEIWAKKRVNNLLKSHIHAKEGFEFLNIRRVYVPFYQYSADGNIQSYTTRVYYGKYGSRSYKYDYYEAHADLDVDVIANDEIDLKQLSAIKPFVFKNMVQFNDEILDNAEMLDFSRHQEKEDRKVICGQSLNGTYNKDEEISQALQCVLGNSHVCDYKALTNYLITDTKRYYYPIWIIKVSFANEEHDYYVNDINGKVNGNFIKDDTFFNRTTYVFLCMTIFIILIFLLTNIFHQIYIHLFNIFNAFMVLIPILIMLLVLFGFNRNYVDNHRVLYQYKTKKLRKTNTKYFLRKDSFEKEKDDFFSKIANK